MIKDNLKIVENNINEACIRSDRTRDDITLICVSKTKPNDAIMEAYNEGYRHFGENKVQELAKKIEELPDDIHWHMIGHLQRNKVKYIIGKVDLIHSVDSIRLAEEISSQAVKYGLIQNILVEINIADEATKFGISKDEAIQLVRDIAALPGIRVCGLMTIAPYVVDSEENREFFHKIKDISVDIDKQNIDNVSMDILSMGMTGDYMVAIEEGSTMVRVGTGIFGERDYNI